MLDRATKEEKMKKREKEAEELLTEIDSLRKDIMTELEREKASRWASSKDKSRLKRFRELYTISLMLLDQRIRDELFLGKLKVQVDNLNEMLQKIAEKVDVDLSSLKTEVETLHKTIQEPMFAEVAQFVKFVKSNIEQSKKAGEQYVE